MSHTTELNSVSLTHNSDWSGDVEIRFKQSDHFLFSEPFEVSGDSVVYRIPGAVLAEILALGMAQMREAVFELCDAVGIEVKQG